MRVAIFAAAAGVAFGFACSAAAAPRCTDAQRAEILAPATEQAPPIRVACDLTLRRGDRVTKRLELFGAEASDVTIDCGGGTLDAGPSAPNHGSSALWIRGVATGGGRYSRPTGVTVRNCRVIGPVRVSGLGLEGEAKRVRDSNRSRGHTRRAQDAAPTRLVFDGVEFVSVGRPALYLGPGVTETMVRRSRFSGRSRSVAVYFDAESARNQILDSVFALSAGREAVAIDGSADNVIRGNRFERMTRGGIFLYRNCGEGGTVRHQAPKRNRLESNVFAAGGAQAPAIWLGSRQGGRRYCNDDRGFGFGSSVNDRDEATDNVVVGNEIVGVAAEQAIRVADSPNRVEFHATTRVPQQPHPQPRRERPRPERGGGFACRQGGSNEACRGVARCPRGQKLVAVRAVCRLENGRVTNSVMRNIPWGALIVAQRSDRASDGLCVVGDVNLREGRAQIQIPPNARELAYGCRERDRNGGDCVIRGEIRCE